MKYTILFIFCCALSQTSFSQSVYYPLQVGDYWNYTGYGPWTQVSVSKDTLMPNGKHYLVQRECH